MKKNQTLTGVMLAVYTSIFTLATLGAVEELPSIETQPVEIFFTGKPYDADLGSYTFKYRNYNPTINRWTSVDPSGFIDGANNNIYAPVPTYALDPLGLWTVVYGSGASSNVPPITFDYGGSEYKVTMNTPSTGGNKATTMALMQSHMGVDWQVLNAGSNIGELTINSLAPSQPANFSNAPIAGAGFDAVFSTTISPIGEYRIVQVVTTNSPMPGQTQNTYLDISAGSPHPFYPTASLGGNSLGFGDGSTRTLAEAETKEINWSAYAFLVSYDVANKTMMVHDGGMTWGWDLVKE